jgi:hypothetical protein
MKKRGKKQKKMILLMSLAGYWLNKDNQVTDRSVGTITLADEIDQRDKVIGLQRVSDAHNDNRVMQNLDSLQNCV